jgi:hypothetical protein
MDREDAVRIVGMAAGGVNCAVTTDSAARARNGRVNRSEPAPPRRDVHGTGQDCVSASSYGGPENTIVRRVARCDVQSFRRLGALRNRARVRIWHSRRTARPPRRGRSDEDSRATPTVSGCRIGITSRGPLVTVYAVELACQRPIAERVAVSSVIDCPAGVENVQHDIRDHLVAERVDLGHIRPVRRIAPDICR